MASSGKTQPCEARGRAQPPWDPKGRRGARAWGLLIWGGPGELGGFSDRGREPTGLSDRSPRLLGAEGSASGGVHSWPQHRFPGSQSGRTAVPREVPRPTFRKPVCPLTLNRPPPPPRARQTAAQVLPAALAPHTGLSACRPSVRPPTPASRHRGAGQDPRGDPDCPESPGCADRSAVRRLEPVLLSGRRSPGGGAPAPTPPRPASAQSGHRGLHPAGSAARTLRTRPLRGSGIRLAGRSAGSGLP